MQLDRNITSPRRGKYAIIKLRDAQPEPVPGHPGMVMVPEQAVDYGATPETDFFLIRLKDQFAPPALAAYAAAAGAYDAEYASQVYALSEKAELYGYRRMPD